MSHKKRISMTISEDTLSDLDFVCLNLGVARSTLISEILSNNLSSMVELIKASMPTVSSDGTVLQRDGRIARDFLNALSSMLTKAQDDFEEQKSFVFNSMDDKANGH